MFRYRFKRLFDKNLGTGVLLEVPSGAVILRLERDPNLNLNFYHSSPGTGTRMASVNIQKLKGSTAVRIALVWSPKEIRLHVADAQNPKRSVVGVGEPSPRQFRVGSNGAVYQVGDIGVKVMGAQIFSQGKTVLQPTAIEAWKNTIEAVNILLKGTSPDGYIFEVVCSNLIIVMLVTGLETYCKRRFLELEDEGINPDYKSLVSRFLRKDERKRGAAEAIARTARVEGVSPIRKLVNDNRIDFQNYNRCKTAFNKGYGIKFGEDLDISNIVLEELQRIIKYRHSIVHISPLTGMLNRGSVPPEEPVFSNYKYAEKAIKICTEFVQGLHEATLRLRSQ